MKLHFVGIGGIGVSALAKYYLEKGSRVTGSDLESSEVTEALEAEGAKIEVGHRASNLPEGTKKVVRSVAVPLENPELEKARQRGIPVLSYPEALGELTEKHWTVAVSGAHGKGTTTAFLALILIEASLDPTVIVGTNLSQFEGFNCRVGNSKYLIVEADEYRRAFLHYRPRAVVTTNIDREHLDCYQNLGAIKKAFLRFWSRVPEEGFLVLNRDNKEISSLRPQIENLEAEPFWYGLEQSGREEREKIKATLKVSGKHNLSNALGALTVARRLGIEDRTSLQAMGKYEGAWRRFQVLQKEPFVVISDYAHHPTEIEATLQAARERYPEQKIWVVFQPHQYQRTHYLFDSFPPAFQEADRVVITEIYSVPGREKEEIKRKVSGRKLARAVEKRGKETRFFKDRREVPPFLKKNVDKGEVVLVMGAGSIYKTAKHLVG